MAAKKKASKKKVSKKAAPKASFEEALWDTANKLRGKVESSEYKHLSLIHISEPTRPY